MSIITKLTDYESLQRVINSYGYQNVLNIFANTINNGILYTLIIKDTRD